MLLLVHDLDMANGDYVFIFILMESLVLKNITWVAEDNNKEKILKALRSVLLMVPSDENHQWNKPINNRIQNIFKTIVIPESNQNSVISFVNFLYDAILLYISAINDVFKLNKDVLNGTLVTSFLRSRTFTGLGGTVAVDSEGFQTCNITVMEFDKNINDFKPVILYDAEIYNFIELHPLQWLSRIENPAINLSSGMRFLEMDNEIDTNHTIIMDHTIVIAGLFNNTQGLSIFYRILIILAIIGILIILFIFCYYIYRKCKKPPASLLSIIDPELIYLLDGNDDKSSISLKFYLEHQDIQTTKKKRTSELKGLYQDIPVFIKLYPLEDKENHNEDINKMRLYNHRNIITLLGLCNPTNYYVIISEYCSKHSLQFVLCNSEIFIDWIIKFSFIRDIVEGMSFLHLTPVKFHGRLSSANCVIHSTFVLKITDFEPKSWRRNSVMSRSLLWYAPEHIRDLEENNKKVVGSQAGDVYSFGIILQEISTRSGPFHLDTEDLITVKEIKDKVKQSLKPPFRPQLLKTECSGDLFELMKKCWDENPKQRPTFANIQLQLIVINRSKGNLGIGDAATYRMEVYIKNLEKDLEERSRATKANKEQYEQILRQILPRSVAEHIIESGKFPPVNYTNVTICCTDIENFSSVCASSRAEQIVVFLNDLNAVFDQVASLYNVYVVRHSGHDYMLVSGIPDASDNMHAREMARLSLTLLNTIQLFRIRHRPNEILPLRIGIHTGPCLGVTIKRDRPNYCLLGATVKLATIMESSGESLKIHITSETQSHLERTGCFVFKERGNYEIKGYGMQKTFWLIAEKLCKHCETRETSRNVDIITPKMRLLDVLKL